MTYDQAVSILGKEHEMSLYDSYVIDDETRETDVVMDLIWYAQDNEHAIQVNFFNGQLDGVYFGPRQGISEYILE